MFQSLAISIIFSYKYSMNKLKKFFLTVIAAVFISGLTAAICLSLASLIYAGTMHKHLLFGIAGSLLGSGILLITLACFSSSKVTIASAQEIFALIAALVVVSLVRTFQQKGIQTDPLPTILCAIAIMALLLGLAMYLIGSMKLGKLVRYLPFPVIGGFLAGTGWLIFISTIESLTETYSVLATGHQILIGEHYQAWLIPLLFGLTILIADNNIKSAMTFPLMLILGLITFYVYLVISGIPLSQAIEAHWMLGPFPSGTLPLIPNTGMLEGIQWELLGRHVGDYLESTILGIISLLLNISGFEMSSKQNMDIDNELKYTGIANILAAFLGGHGGYQYISLSRTNLNLNLNSRWVGILSGLICFALLFIGTKPLSYLPSFIFSGVLIYIGLDFMLEGLVHIKKKISLLEYLIVFSITIIIIIWGLLAGIFIGALLSLAIFVSRFSRIPVISSILTGQILHSNVERNRADNSLLEQFGDRILIINVRGYLFFGNAYEMANHLINQFDERWNLAGEVRNIQKSHSSADRFVILNFSGVLGLEVTGAMSLINLVSKTRDKQICVLFANLPDPIAKEINRLTALEQQPVEYEQFPDIDHALAWCENELLAHHQTSPSINMEQLFRITFPEIKDPNDLLDFAEKLTFKKGEIMCYEADQTKDLFWIAEGELDAVIAYGEKDKIRLKRLLPGSIVGEMALYLNQPRSATIIAITDCVTYRFNPKSLEKITQEQPVLAAAFHKNVVSMIAKRLHDANRLLLYV